MGEQGVCGPAVVEKAYARASLQGKSDTGSGSESDLTCTFNSESASDYMPAVDLQSALPMPDAPSKPPMEQVVQKQIPINLRRKDM